MELNHFSMYIFNLHMFHKYYSLINMDSNYIILFKQVFNSYIIEMVHIKLKLKQVILMIILNLHIN